jgi:hypothetical protein
MNQCCGFGFGFGSGRVKIPTKAKKQVLKFWMFMRDEDFSCSLELNVLYGGLRISKLQF